MKDFEMIKQVLGTDGAPQWQRISAITELNAIRLAAERAELKIDKLTELVREAQDIMNRNDVIDVEWMEASFRECPTDFSTKP